MHDEILEADVVLLIDLDIPSVMNTGKSTQQSASKVVELNCVNIREHFNSETPVDLPVNKCICGRSNNIEFSIKVSILV